MFAFICRLKRIDKRAQLARVTWGRCRFGLRSATQDQATANQCHADYDQHYTQGQMVL